MFYDIGSILTRSVDKFGSRPMLSWHGRTMTYNEVYEQATRFGSGLLARGLAPGSRLMLSMRNSPEYVIAIFGASLVDITPVPVNRRYALRDIRHIVNDTAAPAALIDVDGPFADLVDDEALNVDWIMAGERGSNKSTFEDVLRAGASTQLPQLFLPDEAESAIHFTSGTTSLPKGVIRSHVSNASMALGCNEANRVDGDTTWLVALPMHSSGVHGFILGALMVGGRFVLCDYDESTLGQVIDEYQITHAAMGPTMYRAAATSLRKANLSTLRRALSGGMTNSEATLRYMEDVLPVPVLGSFGMTEATMVTFSTDEVYASGRVGSSGYPTSMMQVRVVDPSGNDRPPGEFGQLLLRGATCFTEYLNLPGRTAETLIDGWLHTGDRAYLDVDGAVTVSGRLGEMIVSGNENISPAEVEETIARLVGVQDVAVVGVPSEKWGREVRAFVVAEDAGVTEAAVQEFCRQHIARYKVPKRVVFIDELPKDNLGKVQRRKLTEIDA
ncbi:class I adenylate-forming enzyme family protein [Nocardia sp. CA-120079]|uniref:class I adenylate-forming enzyme family protein n=1 Tax=Nocardia sp. CA-120079 TaxID=3239974 RepID=UPI003D98EA51